MTYQVVMSAEDHDALLNERDELRAMVERLASRYASAIALMYGVQGTDNDPDVAAARALLERTKP